jgi:Ca2+/Na+ antiporter
MTNSNDPDNTTEQENMLKRVAYYQISLENLIANNKEKDRHLLTLSSLAIGLLVTTLHPYIDCTPIAIIQLILWFSAVIAFICTISLLLFFIFKKSEEYYDMILFENDEKAKEIQNILRILTSLASWCFFLGICLTFFVALLTIFNS